MEAIQIHLYRKSALGAAMDAPGFVLDAARAGSDLGAGCVAGLRRRSRGFPGSSSPLRQFAAGTGARFAGEFAARKEFIRARVNPGPTES